MDDATIASLKKIGTVESYGNNGHFKGAVLIDFEKFNQLPEEMRSLIRYDASRFLEVFREKVSMAWAKENEADKRNEHVAELTEMFKSAGFGIIHVETIDSQYCKESCYYKLPWIIVTTKQGRIKLGWRKSVMNLDWSESDIKIKAKVLFKEEDSTKGDQYIHCWGKDKAIEYLKKLNSEE